MLRACCSTVLPVFGLTPAGNHGSSCLGAFQHPDSTKLSWPSPVRSAAGHPHSSSRCSPTRTSALGAALAEASDENARAAHVRAGELTLDDGVEIKRTSRPVTEERARNFEPGS